MFKEQKRWSEVPHVHTFMSLHQTPDLYPRKPHLSRGDVTEGSLLSGPPSHRPPPPQPSQSAPSRDKGHLLRLPLTGSRSTCHRALGPGNPTSKRASAVPLREVAGTNSTIHKVGPLSVTDIRQCKEKLGELFEDPEKFANSFQTLMMRYKEGLRPA